MAIPTLAMIPSGYKANKVYSVLPTDGSGDLDFARTSTATRVNQNGLIETVAGDVPRLDYADGSCPSLLLEGNSTNLITQSELFGNSYWTKSGASIEGDASTAGSEEVINGDFSNGTTSWTDNVSYPATLSVVGGQMEIENTGASARALQGVTTVVGQTYLYTATITNVDLAVGISLKLSNTDNLDGAYFNSEVNATTTPLDVSHTFVATSTTTYVGVNLTGAAGETSLVDNVSVKEVQGFSAPSVDSPLGAFKMIATANDARLETSSFGDIGTATQSVWVKSAQAGGVAGQIDFAGLDIVAFTATSEWQRVSSTTSVSGTSARIRVRITNSGDELFVFGAQLEAQSSATSYIPTAGTTISRTQDSASKSGISSLINSSEGVLYFEGSALANDNTFRLLSISDGTSNNEVKIQFSTTDNRIGAGVSVGGVSQCDIFKDSIDILSINKVAFSYSLNKFELWVNGVKEAEDLSGSVFSLNTLNKLSFSRGNDTLNFISNTKDLRVYKTALTSSELQILTTL